MNGPLPLGDHRTLEHRELTTHHSYDHQFRLWRVSLWKEVRQYHNGTVELYRVTRTGQFTTEAVYEGTHKTAADEIFAAQVAHVTNIVGSMVNEATSRKAAAQVEAVRRLKAEQGAMD